MRVHELAKDLGVANKLLITKLRERGVEVKNHMTVLEDDHIIVMRAIIPLAIEEEKRKDEEARLKAEEDERKAEEARQRAEEARRKDEEEARRKAEAEAAKPEPKPATKPQAKPAVVPEAKPVAKPEVKPVEKPVAEVKPEKPAGAERPAAGGKPAKTETVPERPAAKSATPPPPPAKAVEKPGSAAAAEVTPAAPDATPPAPAAAASAPDKTLRIRGGITVRELAEIIGEKPNRIVAELMGMNVFANINAKLDYDVAATVAGNRGFQVEHEKRGGEAPLSAMPRPDDEPYQDKPEDLLPRPPVVTFLGHVDHGKTSLLDQIRNASVAKGESGGITQHIGAYTVEMGSKPITFLDTPGHAAFTAMRARGANLTDIAVIIIAADDGIMPQTKEAIAHAKAAGVAIMVAINKCDLHTANPDRVLQQLQAEELAPEEWGGSTICCKVSATTGEGVPHLLEMILLQAEMLELKANPNKRATGFVVEAHLQPGMGPTATVLVTGGTLKIGDALLCGSHWGRVKALIDDHGRQVKSTLPSSPVKCLGLSGVPDAGAEFIVMPSDRKAKEIAAERAMSIKTASLEAPRKASLDDIFTQLKTSAEALQLSIILKTDAQGSVEAIIHALKDIKSDKVSIRFIHSGTGNITTNDILLASASNAVVLGFHVAKEAGVDAIAKREGVEIRLHQIIYELIDQVRDAMIGVLGPKLEEMKRGQAQVRQIFEIGKASRIGGCLVLKGIINIKHRVRVKRKNEVLFEGTIQSLKHFQDDVPEVREAQECGIRVLHFADLAEGDIIEAYEIEEREQTL
jgi:translation initiation factor IF-2